MNQQAIKDLAHTEHDQQFHKTDHLPNYNESFQGVTSQRHILQQLHLITIDDRINNQEIGDHRNQPPQVKLNLKSIQSDTIRNKNFKKTQSISPNNEKSQASFCQLSPFDSELGFAKRHLDNFGLLHNKNLKQSSHKHIDYNNQLDEKKSMHDQLIMRSMFKKMRLQFYLKKFGERMISLLKRNQLATFLSNKEFFHIFNDKSAFFNSKHSFQKEIHSLTTKNKQFEQKVNQQNLNTSYINIDQAQQSSFSSKKFQILLKTLNNIPIISALSKIKFLWDLVFLLCIGFFFIIIPLSIVFKMTIEDIVGTKKVEIILIVLMIADILTNFNTSLIQQGKEIKDHSKIARFYLQNACFWIQVGYWEKNDPNNWLAKYEIANSQWYFQLLNSFYFNTVTMVTVGYGDISPQTDFERLFSIFTVLSACCVFAYSINEVGSIFEQMNKETQIQNDNMFIINNYMKNKRITSDLQYQIRHYLEYYWNESFSENTQKQEMIINQLSNNLKENLMLEANRIILESPLLRDNFSLKTLLKTVSIITEQRCTPEEIIYLEGEREDISIYFIEKGQVQVFHSLENPNLRLKSSINSRERGEYFGEISFFTGKQRSSNYRSLDFTTLLKIERKKFIEILQESPEDYEKFCMIKDDLIFNNNIEHTLKKCVYCRDQPLLDAQHIEPQCPVFHYIPNKSRDSFKKQLNQEERKKEKRRKQFKQNTFEQKDQICYELVSFNSNQYQLLENYREQYGIIYGLRSLYEQDNQNQDQQLQQDKNCKKQVSINHNIDSLSSSQYSDNEINIFDSQDSDGFQVNQSKLNTQDNQIDKKLDNQIVKKNHQLQSNDSKNSIIQEESESETEQGQGLSNFQNQTQIQQKKLRFKNENEQNKSLVSQCNIKEQQINQFQSSENSNEIEFKEQDKLRLKNQNKSKEIKKQNNEQICLNQAKKKNLKHRDSKSMQEIKQDQELLKLQIQRQKSEKQLKSERSLSAKKQESIFDQKNLESLRFLEYLKKSYQIIKSYPNSENLGLNQLIKNTSINHQISTENQFPSDESKTYGNLQQSNLTLFTQQIDGLLKSFKLFQENVISQQTQNSFQYDFLKCDHLKLQDYQFDLIFYQFDQMKAYSMYFPHNNYENVLNHCYRYQTMKKICKNKSDISRIYSCPSIKIKSNSICSQISRQQSSNSICNGNIINNNNNNNSNNSNNNNYTGINDIFGQSSINRLKILKSNSLQRKNQIQDVQYLLQQYTDSSPNNRIQGQTQIDDDQKPKISLNLKSEVIDQEKKPIQNQFFGSSYHLQSENQNNQKQKSRFSLLNHAQ